MEQYILILGTPTDGFEHIGPFSSSDDAIKHAEDINADADWWVTKLRQPEKV